MIRKSMPSATTRWVRTGFPSRQTRNAFARRSCSNKKIERDDDSKKSHHALEAHAIEPFVPTRFLPANRYPLRSKTRWNDSRAGLESACALKRKAPDRSGALS